MKYSDSFFTLDEYLVANKPNRLNRADYIHAFFSQHGLPVDVAESLLKFIAPKFELADGVVLLKDFYEIDEYVRHVKSGMGNEMIQFWSNMLDLTSIFECDECALIKDFADGLTYIWNRKLKDLGYQNIAEAICYLDEDESVYITLKSPAEVAK